MSESYVTAVALNYTFHFYKMHENVNLSHEKGSFNNIWGAAGFTVQKVIQALRIKC